MSGNKRPIDDNDYTDENEDEVSKMKKNRDFTIRSIDKDEIIKDKERLIEFHRLKHEKFAAQYNQCQIELKSLQEKYEKLQKTIGNSYIRFFDAYLMKHDNNLQMIMIRNACWTLEK